MIAAATLALSLAAGAPSTASATNGERVLGPLAPRAEPLAGSRGDASPGPLAPSVSKREPRSLPGAGAGELRDDGDWGFPDEEEEERQRLFVTAWGGEAIGTGGAGRTSSILGAEVAWAFDSVEVGVAGYGLRGLREDGPDWAPVALLRVTQRFPTRGGFDAGLTFGIGAGKPDDWTAWYQVALGARIAFGPMFLGGELGFEQYDLLRLAAAIGVAF